MKTLCIEKYGSIDVMKYKDLPVPIINKNQILIKVKASSVNPVDWKVRQGTTKLVTGNKFPKILGVDFSGIVIETGKNINKFKPNDEVFGGIPIWLPGRNGANAQFVVAKENEIAHKPSEFSFEEAAAMPVAAITAYLPFTMIKARENAKILVNGASGGVGSFAIQFARQKGLDITAICSEKNFDFVEKIGVDKLVDYKNYEEIIKNKFEIIFDAYGKMNYRIVSKLLSRKDVYITTLPGFKLIMIRLINNLTGGIKILTPNGTPKNRHLEELIKFANDNKLKSYISKTYSFDEAINAYSNQEKGGIPGKIVITI